jgi:hypoxanthine phosphoribosyltransferase
MRDAPGEMLVSLDALMDRIRECLEGKEFDLVVGISRGGVLPAYLASRFLDKAMETVYLNLRDEDHKPVRESPLLLRGVEFGFQGKRILLCDDVSNSGATLQAASAALPGASISTLVISGKADFSLLGPHDRCIRWPWAHS